jgi:hypothetical protein
VPDAARVTCFTLRSLSSVARYLCDGLTVVCGSGDDNTSLALFLLHSAVPSFNLLKRQNGEYSAQNVSIQHQQHSDHGKR